VLTISEAILISVTPVLIWTNWKCFFWTYVNKCKISSHMNVDLRTCLLDEYLLMNWTRKALFCRSNRSSVAKQNFCYYILRRNRGIKKRYQKVRNRKIKIKTLVLHSGGRTTCLPGSVEPPFVLPTISLYIRCQFCHITKSACWPRSINYTIHTKCLCQSTSVQFENI